MTDDFRGLICGDRRLARADFDDRILRAASGLRDLGVRPGDAVALLLRNDLPFLEASYAARALGAYAVPINWHLVTPEVAYILGDCAAKVLVVHASLLHAVDGAVPDGVHVVVVPDTPDIRAAYHLAEDVCRPPAGARLWDHWLAGYEPLSGLHPEVPESMIYTSGTTGLPKGVRRWAQTADKAAQMVASRQRIYGLHEGMRAVVPGPMYHSAPNAYGLLSAKTADLTVIMPRFDPEGLLALIEKHRLTAACMVPTMFVRLMKLSPRVRDRYDISSMRFVIHAAAPCPPDVKRAMIEWWGPVINEFYGSTESAHLTFCTSEEALAKPGTVGRRCPEVILKALDEDGNEQPPGVPGELYGIVPFAPDFVYNNRPEARAEIDRDGLVTCGDVGYFDDDGYLFLCDRKRDMVISGGVNIYPAEIEAVLVGMPEVADCAVFGIPDPEFGEKVMAVVQPQGDAEPDPAAIKAYLRQRLAGYKVPRVIETRASLPRDDSGKIYKRRLRDPYWEGHESRI
ncbi:MAG: AMP-binding protein [Hyphomicrobiales bacterium]|nr:AMP-binding protein [Hyphomicrobiales bacterium]MCP5374099.1 AMP-binding protein [Hyphomicrobiales bacterium]